MKFTNKDRKVQILDENNQVWDVIRSITQSGKQEEAFYVLDLGDLVKKLEIWKEELPRIEPYYAVKCNDSIPVLKTLASLGIGFDCASKGEISKVMSLGVTPDRIIFANTMKPHSHIEYAQKVEVNLMTFDSEMELQKISKLHSKSSLVIRIKCDDPTVKYQMGKKFGCDHLKEAPVLLKMAKDLDLKVVGVSFHIGSGMKDPGMYSTAIGYAREVFDVAKNLGFDLNLLDIGGGYPGEKGTSISEIASIINSAISKHFPDPSIKIVAEPGRFFVASAYTLASSIHSIRKITRVNPKTMEEERHIMYYINDGIFGSFYYLFYDDIEAFPKCLIEKGGELVSSSIWGPTCDALDKLNKDILLPEQSLGDWFIFEDMGAYTLPLITEFNGFSLPDLFIVADKTTWNLLKNKKFFNENQMMETI